MTGHLARLVAATLLFAVVACGGCAERPPSAPETAGDAAAQTAPAPPPAPTPVPVPPELACRQDAGCGLSSYPRPLARVADCYCPECPQPLAADAVAAHEGDWNRLCGPEWADRAGCRAPMCPRPPATACREGACAFVVAAAPSP
jgi:hypothetical protein